MRSAADSSCLSVGCWASRLDLYSKAGCGSAKFGRLKHDGCIQAKSLIQSVNGAPCLASELSKPNLSHSKGAPQDFVYPHCPKKVFKLPSLSDFQPPLLCRLFHPFGAQLNQSPEQRLRRHSTRSRAQMLKALRKSFIKKTLPLSYFLSVSWRLACS